MKDIRKLLRRLVDCVAIDRSTVKVTSHGVTKREMRSARVVTALARLDSSCESLALSATQLLDACPPSPLPVIL
jgi:hypothetical protein